MKRRCLPALLALALLAGGWKPTIAPTAVRSATAQDDKAAKQFTPDPAQALVYVYRTNAFVGKNAKSQLVVDNNMVATNENGRFIVVSMAPGAHALMSLAAQEGNGAAMLVHNSRKKAVELNAEAGKIYFFQEVFKAMSGFTLTPVADDEAKAAISKEKLLARTEL